MRTEHWEGALAEHLRVEIAKPFAWGEHDCALFTCGVIRLLTGTDPAAEFRGTYTTARGAAKVIRTAGGGDLGDLASQLAARHGFAEVAPLFARRGDVVLVQTSAGFALAVVDLDGTHALAPGVEAAVRVPLAECRRAWRIA